MIILLILALIVPLLAGSIAYYFLVIKYRRSMTRSQRSELTGDRAFIETINSDIFKYEML